MLRGTGTGREQVIHAHPQDARARPEKLPLRDSYLVRSLLNREQKDRATRAFRAPGAENGSVAALYISAGVSPVMRA
jgi:hypothetical protein